MPYKLISESVKNVVCHDVLRDLVRCESERFWNRTRILPFRKPMILCIIKSISWI